MRYKIITDFLCNIVAHLKYVQDEQLIIQRLRRAKILSEHVVDFNYTGHEHSPIY